MKRLISLILSLLMICSLASCSRDQAVEVKKTEGEDLSGLDGEMLYRYGEEKMQALTSALYTTRVQSGGKSLGEIETIRIRKGYDGFVYSRRGQDFYSFNGEKAYVDTELGSYAAPSTFRVFEEYLTDFVFSVCGLNPDLLENFNRDGDVVTYESSKEELLSLYRLAEKPDFVPLSLSGRARFDKEGVILEETLTLKGAEEECVLETSLSVHRSDSLIIAEPSNADEYTEIADIRLPGRLQEAFDNLYAQKEIQVTATDSNTMEYGGAKYVSYTDINTYAKTETASYYISRHNLKQIPGLPEESVFYQALLANGSITENRYNVILGQKIWENTSQGTALPWEDELRGLLPALSDFATLSAENEVGGLGVSFKLREDAANKIGKDIAALFLAEGVSVQKATVRSASGRLSVDSKRNMVTTITYTVEGEIQTEFGSGTYNGMYSVLVDQTENVTLPELQNPTPTTPGMDTPELHEDIC